MGGRTQTTTLYFSLSRPLQNLKMVQKTYRGEHIGPFTRVVHLGSSWAADTVHQFTFAPDKVPDGFLERGHYKSIVEFHGEHDNDKDNDKDGIEDHQESCP